nr:2,3-bisphosphoglycerate-dependent phosphoglycerate mutase [Tanacetum cinerariifolium]
MKLKPDLVSGRCSEAALTPNGKRQSRALAVFLKSQGIRFNAIYTSPLDRARATAIPVCQEMNFPEHMIQTLDALQDMSQGIWEGCHHSDVYTPSVVSIMERLQPDFCASSGETLRQSDRVQQDMHRRFVDYSVAIFPEIGMANQKGE